MRTVCNSQKGGALDIESNRWVGFGNYKGRLAGQAVEVCQPRYLRHACLVHSPHNSIGMKFAYRDFHLACGSCLDIMWFYHIVIGCYVCWNVVIGQFTNPNHCTVHNGVSKCSSRSSNAHLHTYAAVSSTQQLVERWFHGTYIHTYIQTYVHAWCLSQLIPYLGTSFYLLAHYTCFDPLVLICVLGEVCLFTTGCCSVALTLSW